MGQAGGGQERAELRRDRGLHRAENDAGLNWKTI